jgi:hypothetical protein
MQISFLESRPKTIAVHRSFETEKPKLIENVASKPKIEITTKQRPIENKQRPYEIEKDQREREKQKIRDNQMKTSPRGDPRKQN